MPELPEVQTTVNGLNRTVKGKKIVAVSTTYDSKHYQGKSEIKNPQFFKIFKRRVVGQTILGAERRAKNILIHLFPSTGSGQATRYTILVHMKMTGHFVYNRPGYPFVRLDLKLNNGKHLVLSDMRKFAKVTLVKTDDLEKSSHLKHLGPEPLDKSFQFSNFNFQIRKRPKGKIKQVLMDQRLIAGIGNIYADEILWRAGVHPLSCPDKIPERGLKTMFMAVKETLRKGINLGGDSMSDYRNIKGERGKFQEHHMAYRKTGHKCSKKGCGGVIKRIVIGVRSAHLCPIHQILYLPRRQTGR